MKMLVATHEEQGCVPGDYCWTLDGELVTAVTLECCSPDSCGCGRGFPGLASDRATTTAMVVERPDMTRDQFVTAVRDALDRQGWLGLLHPDDEAEMVAEHVETIEEICSQFDVGEVLRRSGIKVWSRGRRKAA